MKGIELPNGWIEVNLDDLLIRMSNGASVTQYKDNVGLPISRIETIWNETIDFDRVRYIQESDPKFIEKYRLKKGDILFSHINSDIHLGKTAIYKPIDQVLIHGINLLLLRPYEGLSSDFLNYQFKYKRYQGEFIAAAQRAVNQSSINQRKLKAFNFSLPPLPEQYRIVEKIETLFSELDSGIANMKIAQAQLKQYRQSVLKSAFEGRLTEAWRKEHANKLESAESLLERIKDERKAAYEKKLEAWEGSVKMWEVNGKEGKKPAKPKKLKEITKVTDNELLEMSLIPTNWNFVRMGHLIEEPKYGTSKKCDYDTKGIGVLRIPNIADGVINTDDLKYALFSEDELNTYDLRAGDLLTIRSNGSVGLVGKTAIVNKTNEKYLYAGYLIRLRPYETVDSKYLHYVLSSQLLRKQIEQKAKSTSGVNNINSVELGSLVIPVTAIEEQHQIVNEIESRLSEADVMEKAIDENLKKAEHLRQSILKKAFEGKLVPQDENDEPVSKLLERIKKEKEGK